MLRSYYKVVKNCQRNVFCLTGIEFLIFLGEKLECQAFWRDGSRHYMVGKIDHPHATSDEDKFRCFVYEYKNPIHPSNGIFLAQSGDATCNGLFSPQEGSRTLKLKKGKADELLNFAFKLIHI